MTEIYKSFATGAIEGDAKESLFGDSALQDYSARGSFNSLVELKSHYPGASLHLNNNGVTVVLKSGAELEYSYLDGGRLVFIRGRN